MHGLVGEPVAAAMSSASVHRNGVLVLERVAANPAKAVPPPSASARLGETGNWMPPLETPKVGRSIMPSSQAMLKKSYLISDGAHQPPPATSACCLSGPVRN